MFRCPSCGGSVVYDISKRRLKCTHCDSSYAVEDYKTDNTADNDDSFETVVYTCPGCGARLLSEEQEAVAFCSYCGNEAVLEGKLTERKKPKYMIPFRYLKSTCSQKFTEKVRQTVYAPKEFRDPSFIEKFRGIYIPYRTYEFGFNDSVKVTGESSHTRGKYVIDETYETESRLSGKAVSIPYDASSALDDTIAETLAPYHKSQMTEFKEGYLAGFYADLADIDADTYVVPALAKATEAAKTAVERALKRKNITPQFPSASKTEKLFGTRLTGMQDSLFPVWFLTWRKNDRVAYALVNGETGKMSADLPVDLKAFTAGTAITAVLIFALLEMFMALTAPVTLGFCALLADLVLIFLYHEMRRIRLQENHVFDRGHFVEGKETSITEKQAERMRKSSVFGRYANMVFGIIAGFILILPAAVLFLGIDYISPYDMGSVLGLAAAEIMLWYFIRSLLLLRHYPFKSMFLMVLLLAAGIAAASLIVMSAPADDYMYYTGAVLCLAAVTVCCVGLIRRYNLLVTRPVPSFFDRGGGNDDPE